MHPRIDYHGKFSHFYGGRRRLSLHLHEVDGNDKSYASIFLLKLSPSELGLYSLHRMPLTYDDYTIGWIAALPHELAPARALLDEKHDNLEGLQGDNNTYTLGRMGKHNIVIAALPMGVMGTNAAANAIKDLVRSFKNVRFGLMVGIGGGVPTGPEDVRLGDIVVSTRQGRSGMFAL